MDLPKLILFTKEEIDHQLKTTGIDVGFLIDYIIKINEVYTKLIDKVNEQDQIIREAREYVKNRITELKDEYKRKNSVWQFLDYQEQVDNQHKILKEISTKIYVYEEVLSKYNEILDRNVK